jgi:predicted Holliday junction resolvase-like endonuclease
MFSTLKLYAAAGLLALALAGWFYVNHLRSTVHSQAAQIETLEARERSLMAAQKALEETAAKREETRSEMEAIQREITSAPTDAPVADPIARALDGLRQHQERRAARPR